MRVDFSHPAHEFLAALSSAEREQIHSAIRAVKHARDDEIEPTKVVGDGETLAIEFVGRDLYVAYKTHSDPLFVTRIGWLANLPRGTRARLLPLRDASLYSGPFPVVASDTVALVNAGTTRDSIIGLATRPLPAHQRRPLSLRAEAKAHSWQQGFAAAHSWLGFVAAYDYSVRMNFRPTNDYKRRDAVRIVPIPTTAEVELRPNRLFDITSRLISAELRGTERPEDVHVQVELLRIELKNERATIFETASGRSEKRMQRLLHSLNQNRARGSEADARSASFVPGFRFTTSGKVVSGRVKRK
jgi:hypothetical protein